MWLNRTGAAPRTLWCGAPPRIGLAKQFSQMVAEKLVPRRQLNHRRCVQSLDALPVLLKLAV
ncbi:MAG: hypothetical protein ACI8QS_001294 [Planctomycetota bacterium]|jgi:hypothetical protein